MTYVAVGSVVESVYWETVPDKYQPPRKFAVRAEAAEYAEQNALWFDMYVQFEGGLSVRLGAQDGQWGDEDLRPGDVVRRDQFQIQQGRTVGPTVYPDLAAATAAAPDGQVTGIYQTLWIGPNEHKLVGAGGSVDKTGRES
ncbi:hypothetical protein HPO96_36090 [Kribbella sandramycini]|uniref:Uncharacterized protein n=1 Tax=Kribbella sandramycini TaxID=60450 RepID=A0A7Y4P422_9ACTN|nr:hypothetical protein [Kribbella sandramycini]MBB6570197.1 hypothetical protein [Kribbella sandramycini]NOL45678.1 hypothetical protein [Kribbella sandramycini]